MKQILQRNFYYNIFAVLNLLLCGEKYDDAYE